MPGLQLLVELANKWRPVFDGNDPVLRILANEVATDANLDAVVLQGASPKVPFGIPLDMNLGNCEGLAPVVRRAEDSGLRRGEHCERKRLFPS